MYNIIISDVFINDFFKFILKYLFRFCGDPDIFQYQIYMKK